MPQRTPAPARPGRPDRRRPDRLLFAALLAASLATLLSGAPGRAQDPALLRSTLWAAPEDVAVLDDVAIVVFSRGLATFDVSDPESPVLLERQEELTAPLYARRLELAGTHAYVASDSLGLQVFDVSSPAHPVLVATVDTDGAAAGLEIVGHHLFLADGYEDGLLVFDISDPDSPALIGSCNTPGACFSVCVAFGHAYCADGMEGIFVIDVSDPADPLPVRSVHMVSYPPWEIRASGNFLYSIGCSGEKSWDPNGMSVHDISVPGIPRFCGSFSSASGVSTLRVRDSLAYIANAGSSLSVVDVSDPSEPVEVAEIMTAGYASGIRLDGDRAFVTARSGGLFLLDLSNPAYPEVSARWWEAGGVGRVAAQDRVVYAADADFGIHAVDVHVPEAPQILGRLELPGPPRNLFTDGELLVVADDQAGLFVIDASDPADLAIAGHAAITASDIAPDGRYVCVVSQEAGFGVVDLADPSEPEVVGGCDLPGYPNAVAASGGYACVSAGTVVQVVDLADPKHPLPRGICDPAEFTRTIACAGTHAYVGFGNNGLLVVDFSDPDLPHPVAELRFDGMVRNMTIEGDRLHLAAGGLRVIDISDPESPAVVGDCTVAGILDVAVEGGNAYTADGGMLSILDLQAGVGVPDFAGAAATAPAIRLANPVRGEAEILLDLDRPGMVRLDCHDVAGRCVQTLYDGTVRAGTQRIHWETESLPAGVYFLRVTSGTSGDGTATRGVVLIR